MGQKRLQDHATDATHKAQLFTLQSQPTEDFLLLQNSPNHLFKQFKERYEKVNEKELDNRIIVYLLAKIMRDKNLRPWSINTVDKMLTNHKVNFFEEFESMMFLIILTI